MDRLLDIKNLKISFNNDFSLTEAVNGIDLYINDKEILGLAGESGSGKSVTALSLTRLLPSTAVISGSVIFQGQDLLKLKTGRLNKIRGSKIGYIFQEPTSFLNPVFSIGFQISEALIFHQGLTKKQAFDVSVGLLEQVHMPRAKEQMYKYPHQLSGGMNQRVMIAMALACRPKLLIADEPTTALDVTIESGILALLEELRSTLGLSVLLISHDLSIMQRLAERIAVMKDGLIVECAGKDKIFKNPEADYTKMLLDSVIKL